ncbi:NAD(P)-binding domain protein [Cordyceps fumosorosea ARSEF 2679]|uniref:NAD(P)-binding domain protein n=1 Tax=Cordyceps fumosorosea (strain ARSEF 2679) TaxID=1081104 RepID=A0A168BKL7_CORFA|nr:NAD(P)-binding domain protein [Cordyceps fumosorosea ARSEF 2679]OAA70233.1 NAD(P)-binding domain protein [Cordyceps fumosorosea ARSEF 2679]
MPAAAIIGSTGLVGSNILSTVLAGETYTPVSTITRRAPKATSSALNAVIDADTNKWASLLSNLSPSPATVFSALGTTRAAAGGLANQWKIDHDLNIELARAAKAAGATTFVFISSGGTRGLLSRSVPYSKMKNGVEDAIRELGFEHGIVLKPGVILGEREEARAAESWFQSLTHGLGRVSGAAKDFLGQDAEVIARAAVRAAQIAEEGKAPAKYWVVEASDIIRLGRTEWKEAEKPVEEGAGKTA